MARDEGRNRAQAIPWRIRIGYRSLGTWTRRARVNPELKMKEARVMDLHLPSLEMSFDKGREVKRAVNEVVERMMPNSILEAPKLSRKRGMMGRVPKAPT